MIGMTIPALGIAGLVYALAGPHLPDAIAHRGLELRLVAEVLYMSTRGLFRHGHRHFRNRDRHIS